MNPFISLIILLAVLSAQAQTPIWTQFPNSPVGGGNFRNDDITFVDLTNGWSARGTDGLYRTTNGGQSWFSVTPQVVANKAHFRSIGFASPTRGWAGNLGPGSYDGNVTDTNMLYETFNGGNTWSVVPAINNSGMAGFCAMHIPDLQHIYGVGRVRGPAYFVKSVDGGSTWFTTNLTAAGIMGGLMDVFFMNTNLGFAVGMDTNSYYSPPYFASIARTTNGGLNWQVVASAHVTNSYFWKMSWPTTNIGYVSLQQNSSYSSFVFYKTTDGGQTWVSNGIPLATFGSPTSFELQGIGFVSTNEGWLGGGSVAAPFNMIHTLDGGLTWKPSGYVNANNLNRFRFASPTLGYLSGIKLHVFHIPPATTVFPASTNIAAGSSLTFTSINYGTPPLQYQWQFNGTNIFNATNSFLSLTSIGPPNLGPGNIGKYNLVLSDFSGSVTSSVARLTVVGIPFAPGISASPQSLVVGKGSNATFSVTANGTEPLRYQWLFNNTNISGATNISFTRTNVQTTNTGNYFVIITNVAGSITSSIAVLALNFLDDFDGYFLPSVLTNPAVTNGYKIFYGAASGGYDFKAVFGFDYSSVTFPTNIPPAPHSIGGTTKGLYLTVNKSDATAAVAAINLYPLGLNYTNNFALKFDLWMNWGAVATTEHALFGLNCSGNWTNRISQSTSDGIFFAMSGDGGSSAPATTARDYSVLIGGGSGVAPLLMYGGFGPTDPLGVNFDNADAGFTNLFPSQTFGNIGVTPAGTPGMRWLNVEVRQENNRITWRMNNVAVAQFTNTSVFTSGNILLGYADTFGSIGDTNNFAIIDNVRVEGIVYVPVKILSPQLTGSIFSFGFGTDANESYTVQWTPNLASPNWTTYTNLLGNGLTNTVVIPLPANLPTAQFFRVSRP